MTAGAAVPAFFLATAVVLLACWCAGGVAVRLGQPPVVGEMVAGVLLGPSVFGLVAPAAQQALLPEGVGPFLHVAGQLGLVVYMFGAGHEFGLGHVRHAIRTVGAVSAAGTLVPLGLGAAVTALGAGPAGVGRPGVSPVTTAAFTGVALAVTAFPMLARIVTERGIAGTRFGSVALACGALDDVLAWALLAVVVSLHAGSAAPAVTAAAGGLVFVLALVLAGRRALTALFAGDRDTGDRRGDDRRGDDRRLLVTALVLFAAAWFTDAVGLYAVFGAFSVGLALPRVPAADAVVARITPFGRLVLLPLFFASSGLQTRFALLTDPRVLAFALACVAVAVAGKFGAGWAAARLAGEPGPVAVRVGALLNARGLMQLVALDVGREAGLVSPAMFTVLVLVALVTTVMTAPVLSLLDRRDRTRRTAAADVPLRDLTAP